MSPEITLALLRSARSGLNLHVLSQKPRKTLADDLDLANAALEFGQDVTPVAEAIMTPIVDWLFAPPPRPRSYLIRIQGPKANAFTVDPKVINSILADAASRQGH
jgi:hypothetical protein